MTAKDRDPLVFVPDGPTLRAERGAEHLRRNDCTDSTTIEHDSTPIAATITAEPAGTGPSLHAGVSSAEAGGPPVVELFDVPLTTARLVNLTHATRGRVVAVGTTATRALESAATIDGLVHAADGWTDLVLGPDRPVRVVDGLITGWHDAGSSHLLLLEQSPVLTWSPRRTRKRSSTDTSGMSSETARSCCRSSELISRVFMNHVLFGRALDFSESELPSG